MPFRIAISGIRAATGDLNVIGNNIANVNTAGFKGSRAEFADVFAVSNTGVASQASGQGVNTARVSRQFTQGNITFTDNSMDLAVSGQGFFIVDDDGSQLYTRDGAFGLDREGYIVNAQNQRLKGFTADASGTISGQLGAMRISTANTSPRATSTVQLGANLDSQESAPLVTTFDPNDNASFNFTTATTVFDSLGGGHLAQFYFVKTGAGSWDMHTAIDGTLSGGASPLAFGTTGTLTTPAGGTITLPAVTPAGGGSPLNLTLNVSEMTQFGASFGVDRVVQDGYTTGRLSGIDIDTSGNIFARYTNGQSHVQGQVALANFPNPQGLRALGQNNWAESYDAGAVLIGAPGSSSLGLVQAGALEDSNVDLSEQLVKLIVAQRNFQANTEVIQTADATTQSIINIR
ncbi:MAG TPA: flagellar hook protein FlgE [Gammaproteobacteria bacterium]|nr:flagellar hook protein FlgE [Gammaproteobacteria bacterium]